MLDRGRSLLGEGDYGKWDIKTRFSVCWSEVEACLERKPTENGTLRQDFPYVGQRWTLVGRGRLREMEYKDKILRMLGRGRSLLGEGDYGKWDIKTKFFVFKEKDPCQLQLTGEYIK
jgi:hypothetical protein